MTPSRNFSHSYGKWQFTVSFPLKDVKHGDFLYYISLPEGIFLQKWDEMKGMNDAPLSIWCQNMLLSGHQMWQRKIPLFIL